MNLLWARVTNLPSYQEVELKLRPLAALLASYTSYLVDDPKSAPSVL